MLSFKSLKRVEALFLAFYLILAVILCLYSLTQIDLGLSLGKFPLLFQLERSFQSVGYFNRPLSTLIFLAIIAVMFTLYYLLLRRIQTGKISTKVLWLIIICLGAILFFAYNAFSYDFFNYIFDARILTHYGQNPYYYRALDFPTDPMLSFMRWTHRVYPYGPIWLIFSLLPSYLGLGIFLLTFYLFKFLSVLSYLGTVFCLGKIMQKVNPRQTNFTIAFFALNPLVVIESLVSGHNDIVMMFLAVLSLWLLLAHNKVKSIFVLLLSIGIKFATIFLLPVFWLLGREKKIPDLEKWDKLMSLAAVLMLLAVVLASFRTNFQPWYLLMLLPWISLLAKAEQYILPVCALSLVALLNYLPYLYTGNWDLLNQMMMVDSILFILLGGWFVFIYFLNHKTKALK